MSLLKIYKYGDPVLRQKCAPVAEITPEIRQLVKDMLETMYAAPGVGLAAPQVGVPVRVVVIDVSPKDNRHPLLLINPKITAKSGKSVEEEGCLSFVPGMNSEVKRAEKVSVQATNEKGFPIMIEGAEGLLARALQHEIDHLDGKLYIDYLSLLQRRRLEAEIKRRKKQGEWAE